MDLQVTQRPRDLFMRAQTCTRAGFTGPASEFKLRKVRKAVQKMSDFLSSKKPVAVLENICSGYRMLWEHERYYGLGMDAPVVVCSWNTNVILVWAWMLRLSYALGTRTLLWFGHGCSGYRMLLEHERYYGLGMDARVIVCCGNTNVIRVWAWMLGLSYALGTRTLLWFGHGCSGYRMLLEHERYSSLGMDAPVIVCSWNTNVIMVWAWMLW